MKLEVGQRALITGASRGLGVEIARYLAAAGLDVVLAARSQPALEAVAAEIAGDTGRRVDIALVDMSDQNSLNSLAQSAGDVDVLVNNAGVEITASYDNLSPSEIVDVVAVNLTGPMLLTHALLPGMIARGRGHIVNISSVAGLLPVPFSEPYCATKFGLVGFTRSLRLTARACGWGVSASVVCPGFIDGAGMFETMKQEFGFSSEGMGAVSIKEVGPAILRVIEQDLPDAIIAEGDVRQIAAYSVSEPLALEAGDAQSPASVMFKSVAAARRP